MKWRDGGNLGICDRVIIDNADPVCTVVTRKYVSFNEGNIHKYTPEPWPKGEANFHLILQAPQMLAALEAIRDKADDMMEIRDGSVDWTDWQPVRSVANAAIAAAKGEAHHLEDIIAAIAAVKGENGDDIG